MTGSEVLLDSWAWWEILNGTPAGRALQVRYLASKHVSVHTSAITIGEVVAKMIRLGNVDDSARILQSLRAAGALHDVTPDLAAEAGLLRSVLRKRDPDASLTDAIVLTTARRLGATLVSRDRAFKGEPDVVND